MAFDGGGFKLNDPLPYIRLWQSFVIQALADALNGHREARDFITTDLFRDLCIFLGINEAAIATRIKEEGFEAVYERYKRQKRTGNWYKT